MWQALKRWVGVSAIRAVHVWQTNLVEDVMQEAIEREHTLLLHEQLSSVDSNMKQMQRHYDRQEALENEAEHHQRVATQAVVRMQKEGVRILKVWVWAFVKAGALSLVQRWHRAAHRAVSAASAAVTTIKRQLLGMRMRCVENWKFNTYGARKSDEFMLEAIRVRVLRAEKNKTISLAALSMLLWRLFKERTSATLAAWRADAKKGHARLAAQEREAMIVAIVLAERVAGLRLLSGTMRGWDWHSKQKFVATWRRTMQWSMLNAAMELERDDLLTQQFQDQSTLDAIVHESALRQLSLFLVKLSAAAGLRALRSWLLNMNRTGAAEDAQVRQYEYQRSFKRHKRLAGLGHVGQVLIAVAKSALCGAIGSWRRIMSSDKYEQART